MRAQHVFLGTLLLSLVAHGVYWRHLDDIIDQQNWIIEMTNFSETSLDSQRKGFYYGYPATTILGASYVLGFIDISAQQAFAGIMAIGISIPVAFSVLLCFLLRPNTPWYIGAGALLIPSQAYYNSTPPSAIIIAMSTFLLLYALFIYEREKNDIGTSVLFGIAAGIAMATRIDISLFVLCFSCIFLLSTFKKYIFVVLLSSAIIFVLCNPYMLAFPVQHVSDIVHKITYHTDLGRDSIFPYRKILLTIPLSSMGFIASALLLVFQNKHVSSVPRQFLAVAITLCTCILVGLVYFSSYYPAWYFYPVLQIFEVLFILHLSEAFVFIRRKYLIWPVLGVLIVGNTVEFFTKLFL